MVGTAGGRRLHCGRCSRWWVAGRKRVGGRSPKYRQAGSTWSVSAPSTREMADRVCSLYGRLVVKEDKTFLGPQAGGLGDPCRAWTQAPIDGWRTLTGQDQWVTLSLVRWPTLGVGGRRSSTDSVVVRPGTGRKNCAMCADVEGVEPRSGPAGEMAGQEEGAAREPAAGAAWGAGRGPVAGAARSRESGHFPRNRGEMRGRQPEEAELDMITYCFDNQTLRDGGIFRLDGRTRPPKLRE